MDGSPCTGDDELKDVVATDDIVDSYTISWDQKLGEGLSGFVRYLVFIYSFLIGR